MEFKLHIEFQRACTNVNYVKDIYLNVGKQIRG